MPSRPLSGFSFGCVVVPPPVPAATAAFHSHVRALTAALRPLRYVTLTSRTPYFAEAAPAEGGAAAAVGASNDGTHGGSDKEKAAVPTESNASATQQAVEFLASHLADAHRRNENASEGGEESREATRLVLTVAATMPARAGGARCSLTQTELHAIVCDFIQRARRASSSSSVSEANPKHSSAPGGPEAATADDSQPPTRASFSIPIGFMALRGDDGGETLDRAAALLHGADTSDRRGDGAPGSTAACADTDGLMPGVDGPAPGEPPEALWRSGARVVRGVRAALPSGLRDAAAVVQCGAYCQGHPMQRWWDADGPSGRDASAPAARGEAQPLQRSLRFLKHLEAVQAATAIPHRPKAASPAALLSTSCHRSNSSGSNSNGGTNIAAQDGSSCCCCYCSSSSSPSPCASAPPPLVSALTQAVEDGRKLAARAAAVREMRERPSRLSEAAATAAVRELVRDKVLLLPPPPPPLLPLHATRTAGTTVVEADGCHSGAAGSDVANARDTAACPVVMGADTVVTQAVASAEEFLSFRETFERVLAEEMSNLADSCGGHAGTSSDVAQSPALHPDPSPSSSSSLSNQHRLTEDQASASPAVLVVAGVLAPSRAEEYARTLLQLRVIPSAEVAAELRAYAAALTAAVAEAEAAIAKQTRGTASPTAVLKGKGAGGGEDSAHICETVQVAETLRRLHEAREAAEERFLQFAIAHTTQLCRELRRRDRECGRRTTAVGFNAFSYGCAPHIARVLDNLADENY